MKGASVPFRRAWTARSPWSLGQIGVFGETSAVAFRRRLSANCANVADPERIHTICLNFAPLNARFLQENLRGCQSFAKDLSIKLPLNGHARSA
jgi:hypothetical protein